MLTRERIPIAGLLKDYETALTEMGYGYSTKLQVFGDSKVESVKPYIAGNNRTKSKLY